MNLPYEDGDPLPPGYAVKTRSNRALLIAGSITFGAPYVVSAFVAATVLSADSHDGSELAPLLIPCVGPFVTIGTSRAEGAATFWLVLDGLTQTGGVAMFVAGLIFEEKFLRRTAYPSKPTALLHPEVLVGPGVTHLKWRF